MQHYSRNNFMPDRFMCRFFCMSAKDVALTLLSGPNGDSVYTLIIWSIRLPMTLTCVFVGASLALAGLQVQTITNNPLASPYTLGISQVQVLVRQYQLHWLYNTRCSMDRYGVNGVFVCNSRINSNIYVRKIKRT